MADISCDEFLVDLDISKWVVWEEEIYYLKDSKVSNTGDQIDSKAVLDALLILLVWGVVVA